MIAYSFKLTNPIPSFTFLALALLCWTVSLRAETEPLPIAPKVSQDIGEAALSVASKRLSVNRADPVAYKLLALSESLCSEKDNIYYLKGLLDSGSPIRPLIFGPITNEQRLAKYLTKFADSQKKPSYFQLLLLSSANMLAPQRRELLIALQRAKRRGLDTDFDSLLRNARNPLPLSGMAPPYATELDKMQASTLARLSTEFAANKLAKNIDSLEAKRMISFGLLVDPENEHILYLLALLEIGRTDQIKSTDQTTGLLLSKLIETSRRKDNSFSLNLLLHKSILILRPDRFDSVVFLQKAKELGRQISFEGIAIGYEQALRDKQSLSTEKNMAKSVHTVPTPRFLDASLSNLLVAKQWRLLSKQTNETWFFQFRRTTSIFNPEGKCEGSRGNKLHSWNSWKIKSGILVIDGYAKYSYDPKSKKWKQADGKKNSILY